MNRENGRAPGRLGAPVEVVREQLLADAATQEIARNLGLDLRAYVDQVIHFATHPDESPELRYIPEEIWESQGLDVPDEVEIQEWFDDAARGELELEDEAVAESGDGFGETEEDLERKRLASVVLVEKSLTAPLVDAARGRVLATDGGNGSVMRDQLMHQKMRMQMGRPKKVEGRRSKVEGP